MRLDVMKISWLLSALLISTVVNCYADTPPQYTSSGSSNSGINTRYATNPQMSNVNESAGNLFKLGFTPGWYTHKKDVTSIKLIAVGYDMGLSVLFSTTGLECPINEYLLFKKSLKKPNAYNYTVGNGCVATITTNLAKNSFVMSVNSRSKCFEEYTYQEFCNGNLDMKYIDEQASRYFINVPFLFAKDQNDDDYD